MEVIFSLLVNIGIPFGLLLLGYQAGKRAENKHYKSIRAREQQFLQQPAITAKQWDTDNAIASSVLVAGSVVVSIDYFKRFMSKFRLIFGGEIKSYSSLIDRGRREALLRMKEQCPTANIYVNCRLETSTISNGKGKAMGTIEVMAYATAMTYARQDAALVPNAGPTPSLGSPVSGGTL